MTAGAEARFIVVDGRRWRATDPSIPDGLRAELVGELMAARRAVKQAAGEPGAVARARARVQDAKVALGERGEPWWEPATEPARRLRITATARTLLRRRDPDKTICPSDVARAVAGPTWRTAMDQVRAVAAEMAAAGELVVLQRGRPVPEVSSAKGPVRYGRGPAFPHPPTSTTAGASV